MKYLSLFSLLIVLLLFSKDVALAQTDAQKTEKKKELGGTWEDLKAKALSQKDVSLGEIKKEKAEEEKPASKKETPPKDKMIDTIKRRLDSFEEIINTMPGLSKKEESGRMEYYFAASGEIPLKLESLDKKTLYKLYLDVNRRATILNTERIMKQIKLVEGVGRSAGVVPQVPIQPPSVPGRPQVPLPPPQPPQPQRPQVQQPPPSPPSGPRR